MSLELTRGERNNNPGNIERTRDRWKGMSADQSADSRFVVFDDPIFGIRALTKVIMTYTTMYEDGTPEDIDTVREIINRWAPPVENNTNSYVEHVARQMNVGPDQVIDVRSPAIMCMLVRAIIVHENGRNNYTTATIMGGVNAALS